MDSSKRTLKTIKGLTGKEGVLRGDGHETLAILDLGAIGERPGPVALVRLARQAASAGWDEPTR